MTLVAKLNTEKDEVVVSTKPKDTAPAKDKKADVVPAAKKNKGDKEKKGKELVTAANEPLDPSLPWELPSHGFGARAFSLSVKERKEIDEKERVYFNGKAIEPVESGVKSYGNSVRWKDTTFYANYAFELPADSVFSVYEIQTRDGKKSILFADQWSYFEFTDGDLFFNREIEGKLMLVNSFVKNVVWNGSNDFVNVHVENGSARECSFIASRDKAGFHWDHFDYHHNWGEDGSNKWDPKYSDRHVYKEVRARQTNFINANVTPGTYNSTTIENSTVFVNGHVDVNSCSYHHSNIRAGTLNSENANLRRCSFTVTGKALISNIRDEGKILGSAETLYLDSKFAFTSITAPSIEDITLIRVSESEYVLQRGVYHYDVVHLNSNDTEEEMKAAVTLFTDGFNFRRNALGRMSKVNKDNIFTNGIRDFIFDTVISRLRMISMLESARDLGEAVYPKVHSNVYSS